MYDWLFLEVEKGRVGTFLLPVILKHRGRDSTSGSERIGIHIMPQTCGENNIQNKTKFVFHNISLMMQYFLLLFFINFVNKFFIIFLFFIL